ncbi:hypothetical protein GCM10011490_24500 [Pseudoclavibacter endophyticus]|uniref:DUF3039 domain-containing protein n=1 Tax=Pseudoclavibacter endophyticus TaxID=1778590 RepID=A0A6H9WM64_9MICO|nr:DUF3039 domain-containing protein [Pseudoclavibacter endophyticus]KAB1647788.1 DUF3039 domain-containing protein [Pseudoclavibacter endophyticus]GGA72821.1 hypothetical protein GCM10011490_24500 [Pseudoclavibacter endophyticus]
MGFDRRVTLRCLCEDLNTDWGNHAEQQGFLNLRRLILDGASTSSIAEAMKSLHPGGRADHPLVNSFIAAFADDSSEISREGISGLTDPMWWKQKSTRWRGAATDVECPGRERREVWLCAGGLRVAKDDRDFYAQFTQRLQRHGAGRYLPSEDDRRLQEVEATVASLEAWKAQLRLAVLIGVHESLTRQESTMVHVANPKVGSDELLFHLTIDVGVASDGSDQLVEAVLSFTAPEREHQAVANLGIDTLRSTLNTASDEWRVTPGAADGQIWSALVAPETVDASRQCADAGELPEEIANRTLLLGVTSHYVRKPSIVEGYINGEPVPALCGVWFVPTTAPDGLPECAQCIDAHSTLRN